MRRYLILTILTLAISAAYLCAQPQLQLQSQPETDTTYESPTIVQGDTVVESTADTAATAADPTAGPESDSLKTIYVFPIREPIMPATARLTANCLHEATEVGADLVIIDMNTYGGLVSAADTIRTQILNYDKPVYVFINNQAISAGALIAIAADRIYMRDGASIGAATVVDQSGAVVPDKYQSFMRAVMRATAEAHGKVAEVGSRGDTVWRWHRDPRIAEAMVDPSVVVEGLIGEGKVLTLTTEEAIKWGYCEGRASSVREVIAEAGIENYELIEYTPTFLDWLMSILTHPAFQGIMIMMIVAGIYFELQSPGVGLPLVIAVLGAVLYFAPLYAEGLLNNWELIVFIVGIILIIIEIFVTPGFGVLGIAGIVAVVVGLAFAAIDTELLKHVPTGEISIGFLLRPIALVIVSVTAAMILSMWIGRRILTSESRLRSRIVLTSDMTVEEGFVAHAQVRDLIGRRGVTSTALRPAGKVVIDNKIYEAAGSNGAFIERGVEVEVVDDAGGVLYCRVVG